MSFIKFATSTQERLWEEMVLFYARVWAFHPSVTQDYILGSGMSHGNSSTVFPLGQEAHKSTCMCCSVKHKGQYQILNVSDSEVCELVAQVAHSDGHKLANTRALQWFINSCSGTELDGKGSFNWSWWDQFVWGGSYYTFGSQKLRPGCWVPPWSGQPEVFELKDKLRFIANSEAGFPLADLLHCSSWQAQKYQDCFCISVQVNMLMFGLSVWKACFYKSLTSNSQMPKEWLPLTYTIAITGAKGQNLPRA